MQLCLLSLLAFGFFFSFSSLVLSGLLSMNFAMESHLLFLSSIICHKHNMKYKFFFEIITETHHNRRHGKYIRSLILHFSTLFSFIFHFVCLSFFSLLDCCCCFCCNHSEWIARLKTDCLDKLEREICNVLTFVHVYLSIPTHKYFLKCVDKFLSSDNFGLSAFALSNYRDAGVHIGIYIFFLLFISFDVFLLSLGSISIWIVVVFVVIVIFVLCSIRS